jgi:hypothetical protein
MAFACDVADGYTLMVIFYLVHVKNPPVLPNLQRIAPLRPMTKASRDFDLKKPMKWT